MERDKDFSKELVPGLSRKSNRTESINQLIPKLSTKKDPVKAEPISVKHNKMSTLKEPVHRRGKSDVTPGQRR